MGITIHYTLITDDFETALMCIRLAEESALKSGYRVERIERDGYVKYLPICMWIDKDVESTKSYLRERWGGYREKSLTTVPEEPPWAWLAEDFPRKGYYSYATPSFLSREDLHRASLWSPIFDLTPVRLEGVVVDCGTAETFKMVFYKLGEFYICDGFTKTQPFTVDEVEPNIRFHKWICHLLRAVRDGRWWNFYVSDEAEYYETLDESKIVNSFQVCGMLIYAIASELVKASQEHGMDFDVTVGGKVSIKKMMEKVEQPIKPSRKRKRRNIP
jgi:hypothetical protein